MDDLKQRRWLTFANYAADRLEIGWWGIPGGTGTESTKTHLVYADTRIPICGSQIGSRQQFQWCARGTVIASIDVECQLCQRTRQSMKSAFDR